MPNAHSHQTMHMLLGSRIVYIGMTLDVKMPRPSEFVGDSGVRATQQDVIDHLSVVVVNPHEPAAEASAVVSEVQHGGAEECVCAVVHLEALVSDLLARGKKTRFRSCFRKICDVDVWAVDENHVVDGVA